MYIVYIHLYSILLSRFMLFKYYSTRCMWGHYHLTMIFLSHLVKFYLQKYEESCTLKNQLTQNSNDRVCPGVQGSIIELQILKKSIFLFQFVWTHFGEIRYMVIMRWYTF